jgi:hypothetical protein
VNKDVCLAGSSGADSEFTMGSVHGVTGLEGYYASPVEFCEMRSKFCGGNYVLVMRLGDIHRFSM